MIETITRVNAAPDIPVILTSVSKKLFAGIVMVVWMAGVLQAQPSWNGATSINSSLYSFSVTSQGTVLVGTLDGVYRSDDDGATFELTNEAIGPDQFVEEDGTVYMASTSGVFMSTDDGAMWQSIMASGANSVWG